MKKKLNVWKYYLAAFVIPVLIACVVFAAMGITPFGNHNLLMSDLLTQYMPFFKMLRDQLIHGKLSTYSFLISIGDNTVPIFTYYLMSPLNLLVAFVKTVHIPILISIIILIKIGLIGWSMSFFLKMKYHRQDMMQIMASIAYALSGFVALYFYDFMWLEALMILPLLTLALERLFYKGKWGWYVTALAAIIIMNYYMGYMLCIYSVIYFVYLVFLNRPEHTGFWHYLGEHKEMTWKYAISSIIAGLLSCWMLIPTVVGMLSTSKGLFKLSSFLPLPKFSPAVFVSLGVGANNYTGRLFHDPTLFVGTIFILGMLLFWLSKTVSKREKHASWWLVGAIFLGMWIATFNTIWHMMSNPAGFPYREAFMLGFVMIMFAYEAYIKGAFKNTRDVCAAGLVDGALLLIGYFCANFAQKINNHYQGQNQFFTGNAHLIYALIFLAVVVGLLALANKYGKKVWYVIFAVLCVEMGTNLYMSLQASPIGSKSMRAPFSSQKKFVKNYKKTDKTIKQIEKKPYYKDNFSRQDINSVGYANSFGAIYNQFNDSIMFDYRGVSGYSSTMNMHTQELLKKLGFSSRNARRIKYLGATPITNQLLRVSSRIKISKKGKVQAIQTPQNEGLGMAVPSQISKIKFHKKVFDNLNKLVQTESGTKTQYMDPAKVTHCKGEKTEYTTNDPFQSGKDLTVKGYDYKLALKANTDGPLYMYIPKANMFESKIKVNGKSVSPNNYKMIGTELVPLGNASKGKTVNVELTLPKKPKPKHSILKDFASLDTAAFNKTSKASLPYVMKVKNPDKVKLYGSKISGTVKTTKQRDTVMLSIPYDAGWKAKVDGKPVKVKKVAGGLTGFKLKPGTHKIKLHYHTPGFMLGIILTAIGILGIAGESLYFRRKKRK